MFSKPAQTAVPISASLAQRWSGRAYNADRAIAVKDLLGLLEAARWSPSCYGDQPWRFLVGDRFSQPHEWERLYGCLVPANQGWAQAAPVLIAVIADSRMSRDESPNRWGSYDTGAAAMALSVEATVRGLMVHQMGGFDAAALRAAFSIPERFQPMAMLTVGYQLSSSQIPEDMQEREHAPRTRRPLTELAFTGSWGKPWPGAIE
jgi:nitroreductase